MNRFSHLLKELQELETRLKRAGNALWAINLKLKSGSKEGHKPGDFLPRRLANLKLETQNEINDLVGRLHTILVEHFGKKFVLFYSSDDVKNITRIRRTLRYLHNAFSSEFPVPETLLQLNALLPWSQKKAKSP